jgi:hypothetical protein
MEDTVSTVTELVDRTYREWLTLPDDQPVVLTLTESVTSAATVLKYDGSPLAPDEEALLSLGVLVELGDELCRIVGSNFDTKVLTVIRGISGTTPVAHDAGDEMVVSPAYTRHAVTEAVKDNVYALYPSLWHIKTENLTTAAGPVEVPADFITPISLIIKNNSNTWLAAQLPQVLSPFPASATNKAIQFRSVPEGVDSYLTYRARFARPASGATSLDTLGVEEGWERIVSIGAAAQVIASRPTDPLTAEYLTQQLEREVLPPGAAQDIRNGLLTLRQIWLEEASRALRADQDQAVVYMDMPVGRP